MSAFTSENINEQYPASGSVLIDWALKQGGIKSRYRLCKYCGSGKLNDELHLLVHCDFHSKTRKQFFSQLCEIITDFDRQNDADKFREILMLTNEDVIMSLGKSIYGGFKSRDQICIRNFMKQLHLNCMFYTHFMILDIMFTFYCMKFYQRNYSLPKLFSPSQRRHGVCVTISIYARFTYLYALFVWFYMCCMTRGSALTFFVSIKWLLLYIVSYKHIYILFIYISVNLVVDI